MLAPTPLVCPGLAVISEDVRGQLAEGATSAIDSGVDILLDRRPVFVSCKEAGDPFNHSKHSTARTIAMALFTQTVTDADGYEYVEASDALATLALALPCWPGMHWDGYLTTVRHATIFGKEIIIQAWKGSAEKFGKILPDDGGVGGEVGVYHKIPFCPVPRDIADPLRGSPRFEPPQALCDMWWPYPDLGAHISFELLHPKRDQVLFRAGPERTKARFWLSSLMTFDSYGKLEEKHPDCPQPTLCRMRVRVGSFSFEW